MHIAQGSCGTYLCTNPWQIYNEHARNTIGIFFHIFYVYAMKPLFIYAQALDRQCIKTTGHTMQMETLE